MAEKEISILSPKNNKPSKKKETVSDLVFSVIQEHKTPKPDIRAPFPTLSTEGEIAQLQKGMIPPEVIYTQSAGEKLLQIDEDRTHLYSMVVNNGISNMFINQGSNLQRSFPKLRECLGKTNTRLDIGTGNGIVSNMVAFPLSNNIQLARSQKLMDLFGAGKIGEALALQYKDRLDFISCDLSKRSLDLAKDVANDHFHDLSKLFTLHYYPERFQKFLAAQENQKDPRLITMFNLLANSEQKPLHEMLATTYAAMKEGDILIPTFFHEEERYYERGLPYGPYRGLPFEQLSLGLYLNKETKNWCVPAFCERYKVDPTQVRFDVQRGKDDRNFIHVSLLVNPEAKIHIPQDTGQDIILQAKELNTDHKEGKGANFTVFKSYRMGKDAIQEACTGVGFHIDNWLDSGDGIQIAPVLYK